MDTNRCGDRGATPSPVRYRMASSVQLQTEMNVDGAGGVRDRAHRYEIGTGFGVGSDGLERDATRQLDRGPLADDANPFARFFRTEIVEQKFLRPRRQGFIKFGARTNFNLHRQQRVFDRGERGAYASRGGGVIVLDHHPLLTSPAA